MRLLPQDRKARALAWVAISVAYIALMWFVIFPWVDRTFVNKPTL